MLLDAVIFGLGIALLVKGADLLVDSAARIAKRFGISEFIIGLTIVAVGTSFPELATGITASFTNESALTVGNIIGASISNIMLILPIGVIAAGTIAIGREMHSRDGFFMLLSVLVFYAFSLNGVVSRLEGSLLLLLFACYILFFVLVKKTLGREFHFRQYLLEFFAMRRNNSFAGLQHLKSTMASHGFLDRQVLKQLAFLPAGLVRVVLGANIVVGAASGFPIPKIVTGLIFVSFGTTLPEIAVMVSAVRKKHYTLVVGDSIGSVIANVLLVGGAAAATKQLIIPAETL